MSVRAPIKAYRVNWVLLYKMHLIGPSNSSTHAWPYLGNEYEDLYAAKTKHYIRQRKQNIKK